MPETRFAARVVAPILVLGALTSCGNAGCVRVSLRVDPVVVSVPAGGTANVGVTYTAHATAEDRPKAGLRIAFFLKSPGGTSGEFNGDVKTNAQGVARLGRGYVPVVDRERFRRADRIEARYDGLGQVDGVDHCSARAEAAFTFTET